MAEILFDRVPLLHGLVHAFFVEAHALAAVQLRARQSDRRVPHEHVGRIAIGRGQGDAQAGGQDDFAIVDVERPGQRRSESVNECHHVAQSGYVGQSDGELVASKPGHDVAVARDVLDARSDVVEHAVSALVLECFVELLETVDVHRDHGHMHGVVLDTLQGLADAFGELGSVRQPGQRVMALQVEHFFAGPPLRAAARPGQRKGNGDPRADKREYDERDDSEIAGQNAGLLALIEIDLQGAMHVAAEIDRNMQSREVGRAVRSVPGVESDRRAVPVGVDRGRDCRTIEPQIGEASREHEIALRIVQFVAQKPLSKAGIVEQFRELCRAAGNRQSMGHELRVFEKLFANLILRGEGFTLQL